jgi:hypothetical protein
MSKWMTEHRVLRSARRPLAQLVGGLRLTGVIGLVLVGLFALFDGELRVVRAIQIGSASSCSVGSSELVGVCILLWLTVGTWSRGIAAVAFLGALKSAVGLVTGTTVSPLVQAVPRIVPAEMFACLFLAGLLLMRFAARRPKTLEKIALIAFVFSVSANILWGPLHIALVVSLLFLVIARFTPAS